MHIGVTPGRGLQHLGDLGERRRTGAAIDNVSGQVALGVRRPGEIDERLLSHAAVNGLQSAGHGGRKDIMRHQVDHAAVVAFHLDCGMPGLGDDGDGGGLVVVLLLPLKAGVAGFAGTGLAGLLGDQRILGRGLGVAAGA